MKTRIVRRKGCVDLICDDPDNEYGDHVTLAAMTLFEGTGCWILSDWRLSRYRPLSPYSASLNADDCAAIYQDVARKAPSFRAGMGSAESFGLPCRG